jgi:hypothetical protein
LCSFKATLVDHASSRIERGPGHGLIPAGIGDGMPAVMAAASLFPIGFALNQGGGCSGHLHYPRSEPFGVEMTP